jgi:hypothetical protein
MDQIKAPNYTILPAEVFKQPDFLKRISILGEVDENFSRLAIAAQESPKDSNYGDPSNEYKLNSLGYRGPEIKKAPVVFAGCSITFGVGVPYDGIWSTVVGEELGKDYINLGVPGWSIQAIVDNLFKYFYTHGNPETLFVVFPDFHRLILTSNRDFCKVSPHEDDEWPIQVRDVQLNEVSADSRPKYAKKPYEFRDFITPEYALLQGFRAINSLITYCKGANIKLVWSTWDLEANEIINIPKENWNTDAYSGYTYSKLSFNGRREALDGRELQCHSEYVEKYGDNFFQGQDGILDQTGYAHPGVHYHLHLAETMLEKFRGLE